MTDPELMSELSEIELEVERRKKRHEPYAFWAMQERIAALNRYACRGNEAPAGRMDAGA